VTSNFDVIVVGGGPIGAACARELALAGRAVLVLEPGADIGQGWRAAAGMLAPQIEGHGDTPLLQLGLAGRELYSPLAAALRETTGLDIGLWREGIASAAADESEAAELRSEVAWQRQHGHLSDWLDAEEVAARWPWLGPTHGALWAAREGALEPLGARGGGAEEQDAKRRLRGDRARVLSHEIAAQRIIRRRSPNDQQERAKSGRPSGGEGARCARTARRPRLHAGRRPERARTRAVDRGERATNIYEDAESMARARPQRRNARCLPCSVDRQRHQEYSGA